MSSRAFTPADRLIVNADRVLRTVLGAAHGAGRASPAAEVADGELSAAERRESVGLLRVDHAGEVAAQALYHGQALTARRAEVRSSLEQAAREETDHLVWCEERLAELGGHRSYLTPLWYLGSLAIGAVAGAAGDRWSLGFLVETEHQVERHLDGH
nr:2-polyprenyl-3-methyl-6-methoxy-1,4-benzoquinone monooxygenase [Gammaproteobacteria bacterium]